MSAVDAHIRHADLVEVLGLLSYLIPRVVADIQTERIADDRWDELRGTLADAVAQVPRAPVLIIDIGDAGGR